MLMALPFRRWALWQLVCTKDDDSVIAAHSGIEKNRLPSNFIYVNVVYIFLPVNRKTGNWSGRYAILFFKKRRNAMARIVVVGSIPESLVKFRGLLLQEMVTQGHQVFACAPAAPKEIRDALINMGVEYHDIDLERTGLNPLKDLITLLSIVRLFKIIKPSVFLGYTIKPVIYGSIAARLSGVPHIFSMIEGVGYAFMGAGLKSHAVGVIALALYKIALRFNQKVFFLNQDNLRLFKNRKLIRKNQIAMINGIGVDLDEFQAVSYPENVSFLLIARLLKDKGVREYAEAAQIIRKKYPMVKFALAGFIDAKNPANISEAELHAWVNSEAIVYLGHLSDVKQAIADSSVYVLPSYHEGMPVTVMEAMAMGRPIITTDAPGCRETIIQGVNGFLVPVRNVSSLMEAIEYFILNPDTIERMGKESRRIAAERYNVHEVNSVILKNMNLV